MGAMEALKTAFERHGGHCFHCNTWHPADSLSANCSRDHVRPKSDGGGDYLHNLVIACRTCNLDKGARNIVEFRIERGVEYLKALDDHLVRCIEQLNKT